MLVPDPWAAWSLPLTIPPYALDHQTISTVSDTDAFDTGLNERDVHDGNPVCVVCGYGAEDALDYCHIIPKDEIETWNELKRKGWIPNTAKSVEHESRNGLRLCKNHHATFDRYFYIRWVKEAKKFIFINHSQSPEFEEYHGKAILLDPDNRRVPFYTLFIIHECRVRGMNPFAADRPIESSFPYHNWTVRSSATSNNIEENPSTSDHRTLPLSQPSSAPQNNSSNEPSSSSAQFVTFTHPLASPEMLEEMVRRQRTENTWKACVMEGTSWEGTTQENIDKYSRLIGPTSEREE
ncbi:hypothetical protein DL96DRAFT_1616802 [Flagelloscypha sp. PMI_526]|nr:hypothetical protein DL96DRAFT_1616802 [Flagelloscypha sp. PMI_526]